MGAAQLDQAGRSSLLELHSAAQSQETPVCPAEASTGWVQRWRPTMSVPSLQPIREGLVSKAPHLDLFSKYVGSRDTLHVL